MRRLLAALMVSMVVHPDVRVAGAQHAPLEMTARKREIVRAAAAPYRGIAVEVVVESQAAAERAFGTALVEVLRSAGLVVNRAAGGGVGGSCPMVTGLQVLFSPERSGAANAISEALGRAKVVGSPVSGCRITGKGVLIIVVRERP